MDDRPVLLIRGRSQRAGGDLQPVPSRGLETAGVREYEMLLAEGHYRCPHCRRADLNEMTIAAGRMR